MEQMNEEQAALMNGLLNGKAPVERTDHAEPIQDVSDEQNQLMDEANAILEAPKGEPAEKIETPVAETPKAETPAEPVKELSKIEKLFAGQKVEKVEVPVEQKVQDYEAKIKEYEAKVAKYESNTVMKNFVELMENDPEFNPQEYFKKLAPQDFSHISKEDMYIMGVEKELGIKLTDEQKEAELDGFDSDLKKQRESVAFRKQFESESTTENPFQERLDNLAKVREISNQNYQKAQKDFATITSELIGEKYGEVEITKAQIEAIEQRLFNPQYYFNEDGSIDMQRAIVDNLKSVLNDPSLAIAKTQAEIKGKEEILKEVTNPSNGKINSSLPASPSKQAEAVDEAEAILKGEGMA